MEPSKARALVARIFDGKLTATPVETEDGPRFLMEGTASLVPMLAIEGEGGQQKPPDKYVSPAGHSRDLVKDIEGRPGLYLCDAGDLNPQRRRHRRSPPAGEEPSTEGQGR
jgi:hypothetical protein